MYVQYAAVYFDVIDLIDRIFKVMRPAVEIYWNQNNKEKKTTEDLVPSVSTTKYPLGGDRV